MNREGYTANFVEMLLTLLRGNTSLGDALHIMAQQGIERPVQESAEELLVIMKKGRGISTSMSLIRAGKVYFAPLYISLIRAAELTGSIEGVLSSILSDLRRRRQARELIQSIMVYPAIIIAAACIGTLVLIFKGIPLFAQAGLLSGPVGEEAMRGIIGAGLFLLSAGGLLLWVYSRIFGKDSAEYRIFYLLSFLLQNNITLADALSQCIAALGETKQGKALMAIKKDIIAGTRLSQAFSRSMLFSPYVSGWLAVGDESGDIGGVFKNIADFFQQRDAKTREFAAKCIEPAVIVVTGVYLAIIMLTVIVPILTHAGGVL
jgi:type II secretory pathway component PulF